MNKEYTDKEIVDWLDSNPVNITYAVQYGWRSSIVRGHGPWASKEESVREQIKKVIEKDQQAKEEERLNPPKPLIA